MLGTRGGWPTDQGGVVQSVGPLFLDEVRDAFRGLRRQGERTLAQVEDADVAWTPDGESNSIGVIVKHLHGNMRSRWTDFLTSDGEKPDRHRDLEFEAPPATVAEVRRLWDEGWDLMFDGLDALTPDDLLRTITIRGEPHTVLRAILRQLSHNATHVGQIVWIAKHRRGELWQTLSIPRGKSEAYLRKVP